MPAYAQETPVAATTADNAALMNLREKFLKKISKKMEEADLMLEGGNKLKLAALRSGNMLPDDETLIFRGILGTDKLRLKNDIFALVRDDQLMISLGDFVDATDLSITVSPEKGIATGWFIREDQDFFLDVNKNEAIIMGQAAKLKSGEAVIIDDTLFVNSAVIEKWFGIEINIDLTSLYLDIKTSQPFPIEERNMREKRPLYAASRTPSTLPLQEEPYSILSTKPYFDVSLNSTFNKTAGATEAQKNSGWAVTGAGDFLGFSSRTFAAGTLYSSRKDSEFFSSLRQTLSREDPDGNLLGPLNASEIAFGDISSVPQALGGGSTTGLGARVSNKLFNDSTSLNSVDIEGDALPGWEVELFRNEGTLGLQTVNSDGRYLFPSVFLFAGNNVLKLVFYGPQGEIREETREIYAGANLGLTGGKWDVSVAATKMQLYGSPTFSDETEGDPHLSGTYAYSLGKLGSGRVGMSSFTRIENDPLLPAGPVTAARKNIFNTGFSSTFLGTLYSSDFGYDMDGATAASYSMRRNFGKHMTGLIYSFEDQGFGTSLQESVGDSQRLQAYLNGPIAEKLWDLQRPTYSLSFNRREVDNGITTLSSTVGISGRLGAIGVGAGLGYSEVTDPAGNVTPFEDRLFASFNASGRFEKGRWRATTSFDVQPFELLTFTGQYTYPFTRQLEGAAEVRHNIDSKLTQLDLSANWLAEKFTLSPRVSIDNQNNMQFLANMRFGLAPNPYSGGYDMYRNSMTTNGGVASRVFLDANGDGIYNTGEELIEDAEVRALQSNRRTVTDKKGIAFIPDLPRSRKTDVALSTDTLPDVFYVSLEEGVSVIPRPGVTSKIDFPVVVGGEIDGEAGYKTEDGGTRLARNVSILLNAPNGKISNNAKSEQDGFFSVSAIKPGFYYLTATPAPGSPAGYMLPVPMEFDAKGSTYYGRKLMLTSGANVGFIFTSTNALPGDRKARVPLRSDIAKQETRLRLGEYHSRMGLTVGWYKFRMQNKEISDFFNPAQDIESLVPDPATGLMSIPLKPNGPLNMAEAARICEKVYHAGFACAVETITTYHNNVKSVKAAEKPPEKASEKTAPSEVPG